MEQIYAGENGMGWFSKPVSISPENNFTTQIYGNVAQTELLGLLGFAVGRRNLLILTT